MSVRFLDDINSIIENLAWPTALTVIVFILTLFSFKGCENLSKETLANVQAKKEIQINRDNIKAEQILKAMELNKTILTNNYYFNTDSDLY